MSSFPPPSPGLSAERGTAWSGTPLGSAGASCAVHVPSQHLVHPQWGSQGAEKASRLWEPCSAITKTSVCYQHCFHHKAKTRDHKKKKLTLSQPKPAHFLHSSRGSRHASRLLPACPDSPRLRGIPKFPQFQRKLCQYLAGKQQSEINRGNWRRLWLQVICLHSFAADLTRGKLIQAYSLGN